VKASSGVAERIRRKKEKMSHLAVRSAFSVLAVALLLASGGCDSVAIGRGAAIKVEPAEVVFTNALPRAEPYTQAVVVTNIGSAPLQITGFAFAGDQQFEKGWPEDRLTLGPQQFVDLPINFYAIDLRVRRAELRIDTNVRNNEKVTVPISNADVSPKIVVTNCVRNDPATCTLGLDGLLVSFGDVRAGQTKSAEITVENAGPASLDVEQPEFQAGSSPDIEFEGAAPGAFTLAPVSALGQTDKLVIKVRYRPQQSTSARATLALRSNDPLNPEVLVSLEGGALSNQPPVCTCPTAPLEVAPLETIQGADWGVRCTDADGQPLQYAWTVTARPPGSTSSLQNAQSATPTFFVDLATTPTSPYRFQVTATDTWGEDGSCTVEAFAVPRDALHVQLVWDKDVTDVDLHVLNPTGAAGPWGSSGYFNLTNDCYYLNRSPEWGVSGNTQDNPRLDIDDVNGFGPENINISRPATGTYRVGVHYFCDDQVGASRATIRIYCNGVQAAEFGPKNLTASGFFWDVATVVWPGCTITEVNETRTVTQGCQGFGFP
jgi:hypothetical protein